MAGPSKQNGGLSARLGGVQHRAHVLELSGDLAERLAVPGRERAGVGSARGHQVTVDLGGQLGQAASYVAGTAEAGCRQSLGEPSACSAAATLDGPPWTDRSGRLRGCWT